MLPRLFFFHRSTAARRTVGALSLWIMVGMIVPFPVYPNAAANTSPGLDQPYPCQGNRCGCRSAEQCWRSCCCYTNVEKLAWAKKHGVPAPSYVHEAAARERHAAKPCCGHCCRQAKSPLAQPADAERAQAPKRPTHNPWVLALQAQRCQGKQSAGCLMSSAVVPPPALVVWFYLWQRVGNASVFTDRCPLLFLEPPLPPPRLALLDLIAA